MREASQSDVEDLDNAGRPPVDLVTLRPYRSATVLQFDQDDLRGAVRSLRRFVRGVPVGKESRYAVVALGWNPEGGGFEDISDFDDIDVVVYRNSSPPAWLTRDANFIDVNHVLNIALFRRGLVAVHLAEPWKSAVQGWLDGSPRPPLRRIPPMVLEHSFLRGEAKGLWLRGTHARRTSRPDSKNYTGLDLSNALDPIEDSSFAMGAGRAEYSDEANPSLRGTVGTTPRKSTVWCGPAREFSEYASFCRGLLNEVEQTFGRGNLGESIFPELAEEISSLDGVCGAYEVLFEWPESPAGDDADVEMAESIELVERTDITVTGRSEGPDFRAGVTFPDECVPVPAEIEVRPVESGFALDCAIYREERRPTTGILYECFKNTDVVSVYYESGHTIVNGRLYKFEVRPAHFKNWAFRDFSGFDVTVEKPPFSGAAMYDSIGAQNDRSLFSWVVNKYGDGYLTCDDGPGETADFVQVSSDLDRLSLFHVKAAQSSSRSRGVSAQAYEVVASQAAKNLVFLNPRVLRERLGRRAAYGRPSWTGGSRVATRSDFLEAMDSMGGNIETAVYIIQPHLRQDVYRRCRDQRASVQDGLRLRLLETLLNNVRSSAVSYSSDVHVIAESAS